MNIVEISVIGSKKTEAMSPIMVQACGPVTMIISCVTDGSDQRPVQISVRLVPCPAGCGQREASLVVGGALGRSC